MPVLVFATVTSILYKILLFQKALGPSATCTDTVDQTPRHHRHPSRDTALPTPVLDESSLH